MKRILPLTLALMLVAAQCQAGYWMKLGGPASGGVVVDGEIGSTSHGSSTTTSSYPIYSIFTTTTAGSVRYAHIYVTATDTTETACLSLQADSDGGTVHLYGSASVSATGWLNIDLGSAFTLVGSTNYRLVVLTDDPVTFGVHTTYSVGYTYRGNTFTVTCGDSVTYGANVTGRYLAIILDNNSGDPE